MQNPNIEKRMSILMPNGHIVDVEKKRKARRSTFFAPDQVDGEDKPSFGKVIEYWLVCIGYAVGFGNIVRFSYLMYSNGGAAFLIPYITALICIAFPCYFLETAWGQLINCKMQHRFSVINPNLWGISMTQLIVALNINTYYTTMLPWTLTFLYHSFRSPLPWALSEEERMVLEAQGTPAYWKHDFFSKQVLHKSESFFEQGTMVWTLLFATILSYQLIYLVLFRGSNSLGKVVYVTVSLPYLILGILLLTSVFREGAIKGISFMVLPKFSGPKAWYNIIKDPSVWVQAFVQIIYSSGVGAGPLVMFASHRDESEPIRSSSFWIPVINSGTSLFAGFTIFSFIGHIAHKLDQPIEDIVEQGFSLAFVAYPGMLSLMPWPNVFSVLFFVMMVTVGIDSIFSFADYLIQGVLDWFPEILDRMRKEIYIMGMMSIFFFLNLPFILEGGFHTFDLFNNYSANTNLLIVLTMEVLILGRGFGIDKLEQLLRIKTCENMPGWIKFLLKWITPLVLIAVTMLSLWSEILSDYLSYDDGTLTKKGWMQKGAPRVIGFFLNFGTLIFIPVGLFWNIEGPTIQDIILRDFKGEFDDNGDFRLVDTKLLDNGSHSDSLASKDYGTGIN